MRLDFDIPDDYNEEWKTIPTFPIYEASSAGRVRRAKSQRVVRQYINKAGYAVVTMSVEARSFVRLAHVVVAAAFLGPKPTNHFISHIDGDKLNNAPHNLRYMQGMSYSGAPAPNAALAVSDVPAGANWLLIENLQVLKTAVEPKELLDQIIVMAQESSATDEINGTKTKWGSFSGAQHDFAPMSFIVYNADSYVTRVVALLYVGPDNKPKPETVEPEFEDLE